MTNGLFRASRRCAALAVAALMVVPLSGAKAAWPEKPIKIVLPFGAGGVADVTSRIMADRLSQKLGQHVVIENMPGPGGINAARAVITAPPDGYRSPPGSDPSQPPSTRSAETRSSSSASCAPR